jgi:serine protease Do
VSVPMIKRSTLAMSIIAVVQVIAPAQQPAKPEASAVRPEWAVTVIHRLDLGKLIARLEKEQNVRVGFIPGVAENPVNITTGLIIDEEGHVATRLGNIDPQDKDEDVSVVTSDQVSYKATLVGVDVATGFAVLQVDGLKGRRPVPVSAAQPGFGSAIKILSTDVYPERGKVPGQILIIPSFRVENGEVAKGTTYSDARSALTIKLSHSTFGPREDSGIVTTMDYQVVGMVQSAGAAAETAYLFPLSFLKDSIVKRVVEKNDSIPSGWLGVSGVNATQLTEAERLKLGSGTGVVVKEIQSHSTAAEGGIEPDDVIVGLDHFEIHTITDMSDVLSACTAGQTIRIREIRDGKPLEMNLVLQAKYQPAVPDAFVSLISHGPAPEEEISAGFTARDLTSQLAAYFGAEGGTVVTSVRAGSLANRAGLAPGDVVVGSQSGLPLKAWQLKQLFAHSGTISLRIIRKKKPLVIKITE